MMHLRVRNRFAKDPDIERGGARDSDKEELEAELARNLQHVLSALRRSAYAPPLRLVPRDNFVGSRRIEARQQSAEPEPAVSGSRNSGFGSGQGAFAARRRRRRA